MSLAASVICVGPETAARLAIQCEVRQFIPSRNREDARFSARILARLPSQFIEPIKRQYRDKYQRAGGRAVANEWLLGIADMLAGTSLRMAWDDAEVVSAAFEMANHATRIMRAASHRGADPFNAACIYARSKGIEPPTPDKQRTREGCVRRLMCAHWWRRKLRARHGRVVESLARELNLVTSKRQCYASQAAVERRASQKRRNRHLMENLMGWAEDENGVPVNEYGLVLADAVDASVSNPELRRGELMCRLRGFEQAAKIAKWRAEFITVSAPGEYHRAYAKTGQPVKAWNGSTPRDVHQFLQRIWTRTRAAWKREGIETYGFRMAEPHHDGTPHWHLLAFFPPSQASRALAIFYAIARRSGCNCGVGPGDFHSKGFRVEHIDYEKGSAVGYVAKYIAKNIDGHALENDLLGNTGKDAATRIDAWASTWGIRQFQQFGGPSVTVWRELRRCRVEPTGEQRNIALAWRAADRGKWRRFCKAMQLRKVELLRRDDGKTNRYGERAVASIVGISSSGLSIVTHLHAWVFERAQRATWTRVNNCTPEPAWDAAQRPIMRAGP